MSMTPIYPLLFTPIPREKPFWGGSRLATLLRKDFPRDARIGESWEISDYPGLETVVANGPLAGTSLRTLVEQHTHEIVGGNALLQGGRFPLLVKYLDAAQTLSVQVHPSDDYARKHEHSPGKKEVWYIIHAEPGAKLIRGVTPGTTRKKFAEAIEKGELDPCLHTFEPKPGDVVMIPWGTVHAIGAGIVLAEIAQTSDLTYRVYDWNRIDEEGRPRELHVQKALDATDFESHKHDTREPKLIDGGPGRRYEAIRCEQFALEILQLDGPFRDAPPLGRFVILNVVAGDALLDGPDGRTPLPLGSTVLIPATMPPYILRPVAHSATLLRSFVP